MNAKLYRHVFSRRLGCLVAVSEIARAEGCEGVSGGAPTKCLQPRQLSIALALILGSAVAHAQTLPTGGAIVGGQGQLATSGSTLTVQQNSTRLVVNWDTFNIGAGDSVVFKQPSANAVALNRVLGNDASKIYGNLQSNGQVFLINPNGVLFGKTAQVSVGGLFASTLSIDPTAFMAGKYASSGGASASGEVVNQGNLHAINGGFVVLAGNQVSNTGTISATGGTAALAAGNSVTLALDHAGHATVSVDSAALQALIQNQGLIQADGGQVLLTARGRDMLQSSVMNLSGVIQSNTIGTQSGQIVINGGDAANGDSGTLSLANLAVSALGSKLGQSGGSVTVTGAAIDLFNTAINVSGVAGGGNLQIGGGARGTGPLAHAQTVSMDAGSSIDASATSRGNGGTVVLWSDDQTRMNGAILARGGQLGGNGGSVETSSKGQLGVQGSVSASALRGEAGTWLLDPTDITVSSNPDANYTAWYSATGNPVTVNNGSLSTALQLGTNVILDASQGSGGSGSINVIADVTSTGTGNLSLLAANGQNVTIGANISLRNGSFTAVGGGGTTAAPAGGSVVLNAGNVLSAANVILTGGAGQNGGAGGSVLLNGSVSAANSATFTGGAGGAAAANSVVSSVTGSGAAGQAGGAGGSVVVNGTVTAAGTVIMLGGLGGYGGGGSFGNVGSGTGAIFGGAGGAGGAGGSILVNANVSAAAVNMTMGAGGSGGGGGGAGAAGVANVTNFNGGAGGAGGAAGTLQLGNATVNATGLISVVGAVGGGGGGGGSGPLGQVVGSAATAGEGLPGNATAGGAGGSLSGSGAAGGAIGTNYGSGANGSGGGTSGVLGLGGAAAIVYANGSAFLTGGNVSFTTPTPIVITNNLTINVTGSPLIANQISGAGNFTQAGSGTTTLTGANTYTGATNVSAGKLVLSDSAPGTVNANVTQMLYTSALNVAAGGTLAFDMGTNNFTLNVGTAITGAGTLIKDGSGTMLLGNSGSSNTTINLTGLFEVANGTLSNDYANVDWTNNTGILQVATGAVFDMRNIDVTVGALTGSGTVENTGANNTLTTGNGNLSGSFSGTIVAAPVAGGLLPSTGANQINLVKIGTGTQTLTGHNTYIGSTLISGGTLAVTQAAAATIASLGTGAVTDNASLNITYLDSVNLSAVAFNAAGITGSGNTTISSAGGLGIDRAINLSGGNGSILLEAGALTPAGTASGGDVTASKAISTGSAGTITIFSGNPETAGNSNTAMLMAQMTGASGATAYKTYDANAGAVAGTVAGTRNFYYRAQPSETIAALSKPYDGTNNANQANSNLSLIGVDGDATSNFSALNQGVIYNTTHAGTGLIVTATPTGNMTYSSGGLTWAVSGYKTATLTISNPNIKTTPVVVNVTAATNVTKPYDGTTSSNQSVSNITGLVPGDSLTGLLQSYNNSNVLGYNGSMVSVDPAHVGVSGTSGSLLSDYSLSYSSALGSITPKPLTVSNVTSNGDGTLNTSGANFSGLIPGDSVAIVPGSTPGTIKLSGIDGANYDLTDPRVSGLSPTSPIATPGSNMTAAGPTTQTRPSGSNVSALGPMALIPLTVSNVTLNPDGSLNTSGATFSGLRPGDSVTIVPGGSFGMLVLAGHDGAKYVLTDPWIDADSVKRLAAVQAALHANSVAPPAWITPQTAQLRIVADTGELPRTGPIKAGGTLPSSGLFCERGAIRLPDWIGWLPVKGCVEMGTINGG